MNYQHNLLAWLYDNPLTEASSDLFARIKANKTLGIADIAQSVRERAGAAVSAEVIEQCVRMWLEEAFYRCCDGFSVNAEWFSVSMHIKGVFNNTHDRFDAERHKVLCEFSENQRLRKYIDENVHVSIAGMAEGTAFISDIKDNNTGTIDTNLSIGGVAIINGSKIRIAGEDPSVGIYIRHIDSGTETKLPAQSIVVNNPSQLIITVDTNIPPLSDVYIIIKTQFSGSSIRFLNEPRTIINDKPLKLMKPQASTPDVQN
jgi:hypothetical protein